MGSSASDRERLVIGRRLRDEIVAHLRRVAPQEGVGLLGVTDESGGTRATRFYPGTNVDGSATRYTMDPGEVIRAFADIEANGWRFGAIVHSHPRSVPVPSRTDLREAFYPDALLLIVGLASEPPEVRAWRLVRATSAGLRPSEVPVVVDEREA